MALTESYSDRNLSPGPFRTRWPSVAVQPEPVAHGEIFFRDYRVAVAYATLLVTAALFIAASLRRTAEPLSLAAGARYMIAAAALSYLPWLLIFAVYRYIVLLEMLAPLLTVVALASWRCAQATAGGDLAVLAFVTITTGRGEWNHRPGG